MGIVETEAEVEGATVDLRRAERRVAAVLKVEVGAVEALTKHAYLYAAAKNTAEELLLVGIHKGEALVLKQTYLVVEQADAQSVDGVLDTHGHVAGEVHGAGVVLVTREVEGVDTDDVQLRLLACRRRVVVGLQIPVVTERGIILRTTDAGRAEEYHCYDV